MKPADIGDDARAETIDVAAMIPDGTENDFGFGGFLMKDSVFDSVG